MNVKMFTRVAVLVLLGMSLSGCAWLAALINSQNVPTSPQYDRPLDDIENGGGVPGGTGT